MRLSLLAFAAGVYCLQQQVRLPYLDGVPNWFVPCAIAALACIWFVRKERRAIRALALLVALPVVFGAGFYWAAWRAQERMADELPAAWEGRDVGVIGIVDELPQPGSDGGIRFEFAVDRIETPNAVVPSRISLAWYETHRKDVVESPPELHAGERWRLTVRLKRPHGTANPHGFDIEAWLLENNLRATGYVRSDEHNARVDAFAGRASDYVQRAREILRQRILRVLEGRPYAGVIAALAIGDQRAIPEAQWRVYNRTGIGHLISISGLHVTLFATVMGGLALLIWRRSQRLTSRLPARKAAAVVGAVAAFAYVLLAGFQVPAQRTLYMLSVAALGLWLGRPGTASVVLAWALAVVLMIDPWAVLAPGFWLSFGAVALLVFVGFNRLGSGHWLTAAARTQWAVTIGLVPPMLAIFQQVSLVSPIANAFAIPLVSLIVVPLTLTGLLVPWDALLIGAHDLFAACAVALEWLNALPSPSWEQHAPPPWAVVAGVVGVVLLLAPRGVPGRWLGAVWLLPLFIMTPPVPAPGALWLTVLDVGQGLAVVAQTAERTLLYDTGPRFNDQADSGNRIIAPYLRAAGIRRLDGLIVTHHDLDHSGGARSLLQIVPVGWFASSLPPDHPLVVGRGDAARTLRCEAGQRWTWDGVDFAFLHPTAASYENSKLKSNDLGCALRIDTRYGSVLLTADIEARSERELLARAPRELPATLMLVPHHGSKTSSTPEFIAAVHPEIAVFTPGYRNRFGHPKAEIVARYADAKIAIHRTDYDGAVQYRFESEQGVGWQSTRDMLRRYWWDAPAKTPPAALD